jgi:hypothetical protein
VWPYSRKGVERKEHVNIDPEVKDEYMLYFCAVAIPCKVMAQTAHSIDAILFQS